MSVMTVYATCPCCGKEVKEGEGVFATKVKFAGELPGKKIWYRKNDKSKKLRIVYNSDLSRRYAYHLDCFEELTNGFHNLSPQR